MKRLGLIVLVGCGGAPSSSPVPQQAGAPAPRDARPCPSNAGELLASLYPDDQTGVPVKDRIAVAACVWGKFAGPGWLVFHHLPLPETAESVAEGGITFIHERGLLGASFLGGGYDGKLVIKVLDLDGDGVDEALVTHASHAPVAPTSGTDAIVFGVRRDVIEYGRKRLEYRSHMDSRGVSCSAKLATQPDPVKGRQIVIVASPPKGHYQEDECLTGGRHVFKLYDEQLVEIGVNPATK